MRTPLRLCIALLLSVIVQGYSFAQTIDASLNELSNVKSGIHREFTVTTQGGSGQMVRGKIDFDPYQEGDIVLLYKAPGEQDFTTLTAGADGVFMFGPETGFAFSATATTHNFRILFNEAGTYSYKLELLTVGTSPQTVASKTESVQVTDPVVYPSVDGTLDTYSSLTTGTDYLWRLYVTTNDWTGVMGNIEIQLADAAQRNNITLQYDANRATAEGDETNFQPLSFNEQGTAIIGPAEGEVLTEQGINQLMKVNFTQPGTYTYTLLFRRDDGNPIASVTETVTVTGLAGIDDMIGNNRISVFPTLADGAVRVDLGDVRNANIAVTDMLGRVVMQLNNASGTVDLNTDRFAKGTYFIKVIKGNDVAGSRFIVR